MKYKSPKAMVVEHKRVVKALGRKGDGFKRRVRAEQAREGKGWEREVRKRGK